MDLEIVEGAHVVQKGDEPLLVVIAQQEDIFDLGQVGQRLHMMEYERVATDYKQGMGGKYFNREDAYWGREVEVVIWREAGILCPGAPNQ